MRRSVLHTFFRRDEHSIAGDGNNGEECKGSGSQEAKSLSDRPGARGGNSIHVPTIAPFPKTDLAHDKGRRCAD